MLSFATFCPNAWIIASFLLPVLLLTLCLSWRKPWATLAYLIDLDGLSSGLWFRLLTVLAVLPMLLFFAISTCYAIFYGFQVHISCIPIQWTDSRYYTYTGKPYPNVLCSGLLTVTQSLISESLNL